MKILYHHRTQVEDAQGVHIYEMVNAFRNLGHEVQMASLVKLKEDTREKVKGNKWEWIIRFAPNWFYELMGLVYNIYGYRLLCRMIRRNPPDIIYERYALNTFCGIWASRRFNIPFILEVNAPLYIEQSKLGKLTFKNFARFSERWICSNSTWTITVTEVLRQILIRHGVSAEKIRVMPNGIDPKKINESISGDTVRRKYGLHGKIVLGFVGWFRPWHGLESLLKIMHQNGFAKKNVNLMLVGDGPAYESLYRYAKDNGLLPAVTFTGPVAHGEIPAHIAAMDIAVQPSATEYACPMKLIEYMGMGKCILATDQANIRELLEDGKTGFLFEDEEELASILLKLLNNPQERNRVGRKVLKFVKRHNLFWENNAKETLSLVTQEKSQFGVKIAG